jgi:biopolymer transport protein ExbD
VEFRRRLKPVSTVDLVPMIDVVFQLIIYFMVSTTFILTPGIGIVLPESSTGGAGGHDEDRDHGRRRGCRISEP